MSKPVHIRNPGSGAKIRMLDKNVAVAGTAEKIVLDHTPVDGEVIIQAKEPNTGKIFVGGDGVLNNDTQGICLLKLDAVVWDTDDLFEISINSTVAGEGVTITYWE